MRHRRPLLPDWRAIPVLFFVFSMLLVSLLTSPGPALAEGPVFGTPWAWGWNYYGQVGDGITSSRTSPEPVVGLTGVTAVWASLNHNLALKTDGTVWAWGDNGYGQLGDGTTTNRSTPVQVLGLTGVTAVAAGWDHGLAVKSDGTVLAWGRGDFGQLGDGTATNRLSPAEVPGLTGVIAVSAGSYHSLALKSDGTVWSWGYNQYFQNGTKSFNYVSPWGLCNTVPVQAEGLTGGGHSSGRGWRGA